MVTAIKATETAIVEQSLTATVRIKAAIDELREQRAIKAAAETRGKELTAEILAFAGPVGKFIMWGKTRLAQVVDSHSTSCDTKTLAQAFPEAYAATVTVKPYKQVR